MVDISDINAYLRSMSTTLYDKAWWIDKIPSNIGTIVDFGCARADLAVLIDRIMPGRFHYIGIEESSEMTQLAARNLRYNTSGTWQLVPDLSAMPKSTDCKNSILVLNSVLHEVFTYKSEREIWRLMFQIQDLGFDYIAIRDMNTISPEPIDLSKARDAIEKSDYCHLLTEYRHIHKYCYSKRGLRLDNPIPEFLLKYRYKENWQRESREIYLWDIANKLQTFGFSDKYECSFSSNFFIPFIRDKIKEDFGIDWNYPTHIKMLLKRKGEM